ncbi:MAG: TonB-dependent receptor [Pseudomonadales bacterium]
MIVNTTSSAGAGLVCLLGIAYLLVAPSSIQAAESSAGIEEIVVTAERRSSTLQDTAIAISAFGGEDLEMRQIDTTSDLQFSVPNMLFTKTNFSSSNIAIRAVDDGTGVNVNGHYLVATAIFEAEFFDVERIEVMRGPQGTLYGRNTTGGIFNLITNKPDSEFGGDFSVELGNYDSLKFTGAINVPLGDKVATRLAFYSLNRDGYTDNLYTGNDIDDRDLYQLRLTTDFQFTDNTNASLMVSYFKEDDRRARVSKQLCSKDTRGAYGLGCLADSKGYETANDQATIQTALIDIVNANAAYAAVAGGPALPSYGPAPGSMPGNESAGRLSYVYGGLRSSYRNAVTGILTQALGDPVAAAAASQAAFNAYDALGFNAGIPALDRFENSVNPPDMRKVMADFDPEFNIEETVVSLDISHQFSNYTLNSLTGYADYEYWGLTDYDWSVPSVNYTNPITYMVDGKSRVATFSEGVDRSGGKRDQWSQQFTLVSELDGRFNFTAGVYYLDYDSDGHYNVYASDLTAYALQGGHQSILHAILNSITGGSSAAAPLPPERSMYDSHTKFSLETWAAFSEFYYDINDRTKVTLGLRYTDEDQHNVSQLYYVDLSSGAIRDQRKDWQEVTGKIGIDYEADLSFTDRTLLYATFARGFKSGGFNSPSTVPGLYSEYFEPENVDTFEIGMKNRLMDNRLQANITAFYNSYNDMQVTQIVNQSAIQVNTDSKMMGLEAELMFAPTANWLFSLNIALLDTKIEDFTTVDPANPTQGAPVLNIFGNIYDQSTFSRGDTTVSLDGNDLANAPSYSVNFFVDYTQPLSNGMNLVLHADYYYQDKYYARDFNTKADTVPSWDVSNASVTLNSASDRWSARMWVKNIQNDDNITGHYITDGVSGFFTNEFVMEPRTYGLTLNTRF